MLRTFRGLVAFPKDVPRTEREREREREREMARETGDWWNANDMVWITGNGGRMVVVGG
jgi:hypothetical protein